MAAQLATLASTRLLQGFRPSTLRQYKRMWMDFLAFQVAAGLPPCPVNTEILLSFMEFLHLNSFSDSHIANYMAALRAFHITHALGTESFKDERIPLFLKSLKIQAPFCPSVKTHIDASTLQTIFFQCQSFPYPEIFRPLYLLCFSFLRLSNILPHTVKNFDSTRQLARGGDFISVNQDAVVLVKWSKTIPLPNLGASQLCPITAINKMIQLSPPMILCLLYHVPPGWSLLQILLPGNI